MTTAEDLRRFAESNGLKTHPGQDLNNWVTNVLDVGGVCPCTGQVCPCPQALSNIASARSIDEQHCGCYLFVSDKLYAQEVQELGGSEDIAIAPSVDQATTEIVDDPDQEVGEEAARISAVYAEAEALIAAGKFDEAKELLKSGATTMRCELCAQAMGIEAKRAEFVGEVCGTGDEEACEFDSKHAIKAMQQLRTVYNSIARDNGVEVPELEERAKKPRSEYRECMSAMIGGSSDLAPLLQGFNVADQHKAEMAISAKLCSRKAQSPEDAAEMVKEAHPGWLKPEV
jgi:hypothetical protein